MSLSAVEWGRQLSCGAAHRHAVAVFHTPDLSLVWSNDAFSRLLDEPYQRTCSGGGGGCLKDISPLAYASKSGLLQHVAESGEPESGEDRTFSVEDGMRLYRWTVSRVTSNHVVAVVEVGDPVPVAPPQCVAV